MVLEAELALEGLVDRLNPLPHPADSAATTSCSPSLGWARHHMIGIPSPTQNDHLDQAVVYECRLHMLVQP